MSAIKFSFREKLNLRCFSAIKFSFREKLNLRCFFVKEFLHHLKTSFREKFLQLEAKLFYSNDAPRTIIGDASHLNMLHEKLYFRPNIKELNIDVDVEAGLLADFTFAYGPFYRSRETIRCKEIKRQAWEHLVLHTSDFIGSTSETKRDAVTRLYIEAVKKAVEDGVKSFYSRHRPSRRQAIRVTTDSLNDISEKDLIWMMVIDGSFFLQVALILLGGSGVPLISSSIDGSLFGEPAVHRVSILKDAATSMFVVGNQIPLVVLRALMGQSFFKQAIHSGIWEQPLDLERLALFKLLLVPEAMSSSVSDVNFASDVGGHRIPMIIPTALFLDNQHVVCQGMLRRKMYSRSRESLHARHPQPIISSRESRGEIFEFSKALCITAISPFMKEKTAVEPNDVLDGLRMLLVGLTTKRPGNKLQPEIIANNIQNKNYPVLLPTIPSATQLKEMGIVFRYSESTRIDEISLKKVAFNASLHLPRIVLDFDNNVGKLLKNLIQYEIKHFDEESSWNVCEYLAFMRELIRSPADVAVLTGSGVIVVDPTEESQVQSLFRDLGIPRMKHYRLRKVRDKLINYTRPSSYNKVRDVLTIVFLLGFIQTVFSVLAYFQQKA